MIYVYVSRLDLSIYILRQIVFVVSIIAVQDRRSSEEHPRQNLEGHNKDDDEAQDRVS
jgi:hypothetical protein